MLKQIFNLTLDLIYPPNIYCICCGGPIDSRFPYSICPGCVKMLRWAINSNCTICGKPTNNHICSDCSLGKRRFDRGFTCAAYGLREKTLIHDLKYHDKSYIASHLGELMHERLEIEDIRPDIIAPVPMYKSKERRRGYNQASLLAKAISENMNIPHYPNLLIRLKDTPPMSGLSKEMRRENVQDVFMVAEWVKDKIYGKSVLLVDDVFTTGSTAESCSRALKKEGSGAVYVLTFAAGADLGKDNLLGVE